MAGRHGHLGHRLHISPRDLLTRHISGSPADWPPSRHLRLRGSDTPLGRSPPCYRCPWRLRQVDRHPGRGSGLSYAASTVRNVAAKRAKADPNGTITARLHGTAGRHAGRDPLDVDAALADLPEIAAGRADLLGELASSTPGSALVWPCRGTEPCIATERTRRPPDHPGELDLPDPCWIGKGQGGARAGRSGVQAGWARIVSR